MPLARCRVWVNGRLINTHRPHADGEGWLEVEAEGVVLWASLEWAPRDTPVTIPYPYRSAVLTELPDDRPREAIRRRLYNLGYSHRASLAENTHAYQSAHGFERLTGNPAHIAEHVARYHAGEDTENGGAASGIRFAADGLPADLAADGHPDDKSLSAGRPALLPTAVEVRSVPALDAHFEFVRIVSVARGKVDGKEYEANFWVMNDALKWVVPAACSKPLDKWCSAISVYTHREDIMVPGKRTWRLPTTVLDSLAFCELTAHAQQDPVFSNANAKILSGPVPNGHQILVLPTAKLFRLRYQQASVRLPPLARPPANHGVDVKLTIDSNDFNKRVNEAAKATWGGRSGNPSLLADPGKAWVINHMMDRPNYEVVGARKVPFSRPNGSRECKVGFEPTNFAAVNYGFHSGGGSPTQPPARCHPKAHVDYSQLLVALAGWCEVRPKGGAWEFWPTGEIYTDKNLFPLAVDGGVPLKKSVYNEST